MEDKLFRGTRPQIFATNPDDPYGGRILVWAWTEWFERVEGNSGAVAFTPIATSQQELRRQIPPEDYENLTELEGEDADVVMEEFLDQVPLFPEASESSSEEPFREREPEEDLEHG